MSGRSERWGRRKHLRKENFLAELSEENRPIVEGYLDGTPLGELEKKFGKEARAVVSSYVRKTNRAFGRGLAR